MEPTPPSRRGLSIARAAYARQEATRGQAAAAAVAPSPPGVGFSAGLGGARGGGGASRWGGGGQGGQGGQGLGFAPGPPTPSTPVRQAPKSRPDDVMAAAMGLTPRGSPTAGYGSGGRYSSPNRPKSPRWSAPPMISLLSSDALLGVVTVGYGMMVGCGALLFFMAWCYSQLFNDHRLTPFFGWLALVTMTVAATGAASIWRKSWKGLMLANALSAALAVALFAASVVAILVGLRAAAPVQQQLKERWVMSHSPLHNGRVTEDVCSWLAVHPLADDLSIADDETDMEEIEDLRGAPCSHFFTVLKLAGLRDPGCVAARSKQQVAFVAGLRNNKKGHSHRESGLHFDFHNQGHVHDQPLPPLDCALHEEHCAKVKVGGVGKECRSCDKWCHRQVWAHAEHLMYPTSLSALATFCALIVAGLGQEWAGESAVLSSDTRHRLRTALVVVVALPGAAMLAFAWRSAEDDQLDFYLSLLGVLLLGCTTLVALGTRQGWSLGPRLANGVTLLLAWPLLLLAVLAALVCGLLPDPDAKLLEHWQDVRKVVESTNPEVCGGALAMRSEMAGENCEQRIRALVNEHFRILGAVAALFTGLVVAQTYLSVRAVRGLWSEQKRTGKAAL